MIAYNTGELDNLHVQEEAARALAEHCITGEEYTQIRAAYPVGFYTPNAFIRIGLFLLTILIVICVAGLLLLIASPGSYGSGTLLIFAGVACGGALEYLVYRKRHLRSGGDDALLWMAAGLIYLGIGLIFDQLTMGQYWLIAFILALWCSLRFGDRIMALAAYASLLGILFYMTEELGRTGRAIMPFIMIAASIATWFLVHAGYDKRSFRHYRPCIALVKAACLFTGYAAGNYYAVREMNSSLFHRWSGTTTTLAFGWLYWTWTLVIPLLYGYRGIQKKDRLLLWMGLALAAAAVATIRYYHPLLSPEWAMILAGTILITLSYALIRYLRSARHGFTSTEDPAAHAITNLHLESLLIATTLPPAAAPARDGFQFGGGSGGGGGAGGEY